VTVEGVPDRVEAMLEDALRSLETRAPGDAGGAIRAVGHRVVHGGTLLRESVRVDTGVKDAIRRVSDLAPLHNPPALEAIEAAERRFPGMPQVAAFDTAFFSSLPPRSFLYPLPYEWYTDWGVRRFGFHGLSHAYCSSRAAEILADRIRRDAERSRAAITNPMRPRVIVLHLGNGCSASAVVGDDPVATTMGFTPLEGLMMGTRAGSVDPGILLHVIRTQNLSVETLDDVLHHRSGLLGISGVSGDFREVEAEAREGNERALIAIEIYADRARSAIGSLSVTMGGVDTLVFTGGVGENARELRSRVCHGLECLGLILDRDANQTEEPDADVSSSDSASRILILRTREDLMLARETLRRL
jgi:acetate kinase